MKKLTAAVSLTTAYLTLATTALAQSRSPLIDDSDFVPKDTNVANIPTLLVTYLSILAIVLTVLYIMYGGIRLITAKGDRAAVESARKHIYSAVIGLVVVMGVFVILQLLFTVLGVKNPLSENFEIPTINNVRSTPKP